MILHILVCSPACPHLPAPSPKRNQWSTTADLHSSLDPPLLCTSNAPTPPNPNCSSTTFPMPDLQQINLCSWPISASAQMMSIVGRALQMTRTRSFVSVCVARGADQGSMDDGLDEALVVIRHPWRMSWTTFGRVFNVEGK